MGELVGVRAYARHRGVSHTAVGNAIRSERLSSSVTRDAKGRPRIDVEAADREWAENTTPADARGQPGPGEPRPVAGDDSSSSEPVQAELFETRAPAPASSPRRSGLAQVQAVRVGYQARLAALEYRRRAGQLSDVGKMRGAVVSIVTNFREAVLSIPDRCATGLAAEDTPEGCREIMRAEIRRALEELSAEIEGAASLAAPASSSDEPEDEAAG